MGDFLDETHKEPSLTYCICICILVRLKNLLSNIVFVFVFWGGLLHAMDDFLDKMWKWFSLSDPLIPLILNLLIWNNSLLQIANSVMSIAALLFCEPQWHMVERCLTIFLLLWKHIFAEIWWHTKKCFIQFSQVDLLTMKMLQKERKINPTQEVFSAPAACWLNDAIYCEDIAR